MYLTNNARLDLGLEGAPDSSFDEVYQAVLRTGFTGYVSPDYQAGLPLLQEELNTQPEEVPAPTPEPSTKPTIVTGRKAKS